MMYFGIGCIVAAAEMLLIQYTQPDFVVNMYNSNAELQVVEYRHFALAFAMVFTVITVLLWPLCVAIEVRHLLKK